MMDDLSVGTYEPDLHWMDLAEEAGQLREAMQSRAPIEQAKGILMARRGVDSETAWAELKRSSQEENIKLRDLAAALVRLTGGPSVPPSSGSPLSLAAASAAKRRWAPALRASRPRSAPTHPSTPG
jgi:hypothetical protein